MLESLDINGRTYLTCDAAALEVGYPPAYIERLAKGKWIDASFVQGQCFVDMTSLAEFITASERDVYHQLKNASERERISAVLNAYEARVGNLKEAGHEWVTLGKLGVVTVCGLLVALLSVSAVEEELTWADVSEGVSHTATVLLERVVLPASAIESWFGQSGNAVDTR